MKKQYKSSKTKNSEIKKYIYIFFMCSLKRLHSLLTLSQTNLGF